MSSYAFPPTRLRRRWALTLSLVLWCLVSNAAETHQDVWLRLISRDTACEVKLLRVETTISGNNGMRTELWVVTSCKGEQKYQVEFWPEGVPGKKSGYAVHELT